MSILRTRVALGAAIAAGILAAVITGLLVHFIGSQPNRWEFDEKRATVNYTVPTGGSVAIKTANITAVSFRDGYVAAETPTGLLLIPIDRVVTIGN